ncbi:single-stranded DNA-binding protein, partial [Xenorhabdus sp. SGI240]
EVVVSVNGTMQMLGSRGDAKQAATQQVGHKPAPKQPPSQSVNKERKTTRAVQPAALPEQEEVDWNDEIPF